MREGLFHKPLNHHGPNPHLLMWDGGLSPLRERSPLATIVSGPPQLDVTGQREGRPMDKRSRSAEVPHVSLDNLEKQWLHSHDMSMQVLILLDMS